MCPFFTIIKDTHGRILVVALPESTTRDRCADFFNVFGDGFLDSIIGPTLAKCMVQRQTVHTHHCVVDSMSQPMTMFGSRADASNRASDNKTKVQAQQLCQYSIHRKLQLVYDNLKQDENAPTYCFDTKLQSVADPLVQSWNTLLPHFFELVKYCTTSVISIARRGYDETFVPYCIDSTGCLGNAGLSDSYPSPSHSDADLGYCWAFQGKCYKKYMCRTVDPKTGQVSWSPN